MINNEKYHKKDFYLVHTVHIEVQIDDECTVHQNCLVNWHIRKLREAVIKWAITINQIPARVAIIVLYITNPCTTLLEYQLGGRIA